ncbi:ATP-dependent RNA helicase DDX51 [Cephus cinctus]|uniref:ATP-dependent RNA helicase n=1 Tax=Cephus cinctus TaxID=211228 RepID=A0AAJ7BLS8_CEPCN|nr:ATP-dependent RNA helicase DDX51 [Cephus cinctus]
MSLFVINRYQGEDVEKPKVEEDHLSALLKRIEDRKKQKAAGTVKGNEIEKRDVQQEKGPVKKKRKNQKVIKQENSSLTEHVITETVEHVIVNKFETESIKKSVDPIKLKDALNELEGKQDFMVLGSELHKTKQSIKRVLPDWLAHPEIISADLSNSPDLEKFEAILDSKLLEVLRKNGITKLFPVQASMITWLLKCSKDRKMGWWPRDTCVSAPTGSGKTLAYVLPIVQELQFRFVPKVRCLIVLPVQELAAQVYKVMLLYTAHTNLRVTLISGASSFEQEQMHLVKKTERGQIISRVDIVIATPGRLVDHIKKTVGFSLAALRFLVIDEADRSTEWLQHLPSPHLSVPPLTVENLRSSSNRPAQKLLFSATLSQDPEKLSRLGLFQPILFTSVITDKDDDVDLDADTGEFVGRYTSPDELTELAVECSSEYKPLALLQLLTKNEISERALVFTNSGESAHRLAILAQSFLNEKNIVVGELSALLAPKQREDVLTKFADGKIQVLISSDALARGLDIPGVKLVVSYDLPKHIKGYIHRAGRTGRAGIKGTAVSILAPNQIAMFNKMLTAAHKKVPNIEKLELETFAESIDYQAHVEKLKETLNKKQSETLQRLKATKRRRGKQS